VSVQPLPLVQAAPAGRRAALVRRARMLAWAGLGWHAVEAAVAMAAGAAASSIALVGFGADSLIEAAAGLVVLWRFGAARTSSEAAERRAQRLIGASFAALAVYVAAEALRTLVAGHHPDPSWAGIGLSVVTLAVMPPLARAKARIGAQLGSHATQSESRQNLLCAYLSAGLLAGLAANALLGWWWADPLTGLAIAALATREARDAWRGEDRCCEAC
jgi:divalent metal cation (Fe/Co/Zn/Cd) transporter